MDQHWTRSLGGGSVSLWTPVTRYKDELTPFSERLLTIGMRESRLEKRQSTHQTLDLQSRQAFVRVLAFLDWPAYYIMGRGRLMVATTVNDQTYNLSSLVHDLQSPQPLVTPTLGKGWMRPTKNARRSTAHRGLLSRPSQSQHPRILKVYR